jgi:hypothetical protein
MPDDHQFTLRQADQVRGDLYAIADELEFIKAQITAADAGSSFASQFGLSRSRRYPQTLCPLSHLAPLAEVAVTPTISIPP